MEHYFNIFILHFSSPRSVQLFICLQTGSLSLIPRSVPGNISNSSNFCFNAFFDQIQHLENQNQFQKYEYH